MKYAQEMDYLVASILYLATHQTYWARTPEGMAKELSLDEKRLARVLEAFPALFRRSLKPSSNGQHFYSLQARYAQRGDEKEELAPDSNQGIEPLPTEKIDLLLTFILTMNEQEVSDRRAGRANIVAVAAAIASALTAIGFALYSIYSG